MRLLRRRSRGRHAGVPAWRERLWAEPALPLPTLPSAASPIPAQRSSPDAVAELASPVTDNSVRLGFADGTEVQLDASSATAAELRAVADVLFLGRDDLS